MYVGGLVSEIGLYNRRINFSSGLFGWYAAFALIAGIEIFRYCIEYKGEQL